MDALEEKIRKTMVGTIAAYDLLEEGDRVLVAVSGGKDSTILLLQLEQIRRRAPFSFEIEPVLLDQKQPGFDARRYSDWLAERGFALRILEQDTYSVVVSRTAPGKSYCGLCSRMRRGALYAHAAEEGFTKIALGHHREDAVETLLLNLFFGGQIRSLAPKYVTDDGAHTVIRPMILTPEYKIDRYVREAGFPVRDTCPFHDESTSRRASMRALVNDLRKDNPRVMKSIMRALSNVDPKHLWDTRLMDIETDDDH